jgi:hypothetical protein
MSESQLSEMEILRQSARLARILTRPFAAASTNSVLPQRDNLLCFLLKGLPADLVPCIVARDNNVGEYAVPSLRCATTAALA